MLRPRDKKNMAFGGLVSHMVGEDSARDRSYRCC